MRMHTSTIRRRVFGPAVVGLLVLLAVITISFHKFQSQQLGEIVSTRLALVKAALGSEIESDAEVLDGLVDYVKNNTALQQAFLASDRDALLKAALPVFQELNRDHRITHFYFMTPERVCFLRAHKPLSHGDVINRYTAATAAATGKPSSGIERGQFEYLTLRVVHPWKVGNRLIGYVELGEEIEHTLPRIKSLANIDLILTMYKEHLDKDKWEEGQKALGRRSSWNSFDRVVLVDSTMPRISQSIDKILASSSPEEDGHIWDASLDGTLYRVGASPIVDANGIDVGRLFVLVNVNENILAIRKTLVVVVATTLAVFGLMAWLYWTYLGVQERALGSMMNELCLAKDNAERDAGRLKELLQAVEQSPAGVLIGSADGVVEYANSGIVRMTGYAVNEIVGHNIEILQSKPHSPKFYEHIRVLLLRGEIWRGELCFCKKDGDDLWGSTTFAPVADKQGEVSHIVVVIMDVTERKQAADAMLDYANGLEKAGKEIQRQAKELAASEVKYRTLFDSSHDAIMILTPEEGFIEGNPAAIELFGCKDIAEFVSLSPAELSPERQADGSLSSVEAQEMMRIAMERGSHFFDWLHQRRDGRVFPATVLLTRMEIEGRVMLQATVRDISKEKQLIAELQAMKSAATAAME